MAAINSKVRRILGGDGTENYNDASQDRPETLPVGTTRRVFKGPTKQGHWSFHCNVTTGGGATSTLKFYYSDLPNPDLTNANHWKDSGIAAVDLSVAGATFGNQADVFPEWIKAEAVVATSPAAGWMYVRSEGVEV
jgi:hypothetical protein